MLQTMHIMWRNVKWRFRHPVTIVMTLVQPLIWLLLYSSLLDKSMPGDYTGFILAGVVVLVIFSSAGSSGVANYFSRQDGSFFRIHISPAGRGSIVMGHILEAAVLALLEITVLILTATLMSVTIAAGWAGWALLVLLLLTTIFFVGSLSYLLSLTLPDENVFHTMMNTFVLPVFFVSTALIPLDQVPDHFRTVVWLNPFTHVIDSLRNLTLSTQIDWPRYQLALLITLVLGLIFFALAVRRLKSAGRD